MFGQQPAVTPGVRAGAGPLSRILCTTLAFTPCSHGAIGVQGPSAGLPMGLGHPGRRGGRAAVALFALVHHPRHGAVTEAC